jgi:hypothetical protein
MKKFSSTLSRTMAMMIDPPTASRSARDMTLATSRMMTRGAENTEQRNEALLLHQAVWAKPAQSPLRLVGGQPRRSCLQLLKQVTERPFPESL